MDEIYRLYFKDVYVYLRSLSADEHTAEELTQETFFRALRSLDSREGDIRAWLFTVARNAWYSHCRKRRKDGGELPKTLSAEDAPLADRLADETDAFLIHQYLHRMREPYKEVFTLRVFGELPFEKIGQLFGRSAGWARTVYYRAKVDIRTYMEEISHGKD